MKNNTKDLEKYFAAKNDEELVSFIVEEYAEADLPKNKLIEAGMNGIAKAHEKYNKECGFNFNAYAIWWIRQHIKQTIDEK